MPSEGTGCSSGQAYVLSPHFYPDSLAVVYLAPSGDSRPACGGIPFNEALGAPAKLILSFRSTEQQTDYRFMVRQLRRTYESGFDTSGVEPKQDPEMVVKHDTVPEPAAENYDLSLYELTFHATRGSGYLPPPGAPDPDAEFQLWAAIDTAEHLAVTIVNGNQPKITWVNAHQRRIFDSTQVYRRTNLTGLWVHLGSVDRLGNFYTDGPLQNGTYEYFVRHVTDLAPISGEAPPLAQPNGPATRSVRADVGGTPPGKPFWQNCEGNFPAFHSVDCSWLDTVPTAWTQVFRDTESEPRATVAPGVHAWTDTTVENGHTYTYRFRHVRNGVPGEEVATEVAAVPVPPAGLSCGGMTPTTARCIWTNRENADTEIWRRYWKQSWSLVGYLTPGQDQFDDSGLTTGVTYTYRARHVLNPGYYLTDWSNWDTATPGSVPEPLRPNRR